MLILRDVPNLQLENSWKRESGPSPNESFSYVLWPADDAEKVIVVEIDVIGFGDYTGEGLGINPTSATTALNNHRDLVELFARQKHRHGDAKVRLDRRDFAIGLKNGCETN
jgi:hypothetical protein